MFHVKHFCKVETAANVPRLVGSRQPAFPPSLRYSLFPSAFAPGPYLAYDDANNSRNGRKVAPK
jgi:hypothetical protein